MEQNETLKELLKLGYSKEQALFKLNDLIRFLKSKKWNLKEFNNLTQIKKMFCEKDLIAYFNVNKFYNYFNNVIEFKKEDKKAVDNILNKYSVNVVSINFIIDNQKYPFYNNGIYKYKLEF